MFLGVDLGTSSVKVIIMDVNGKLIDSASEKYPLYFPQPNWSEQSPVDWWEGTKKAIQTLSERNPECAAKIEGISFSGQMHGLVLQDESGEVLTPAILWNDGRTQKECDYLNDVIGRDTLSKHTGNIALCGFTAPKVLWVRENLPEVFEQVRHILLPKDYLRYRLTGDYKIDCADAAGTAFFDVENRCWSKEIVEVLGIKESYLPEVYECYEVTGTILPEVADELGISREAKVIGGGGDQAVGAVGTGTVSDGCVSVALGTSGVIFGSTSKYFVDPANRLHSFCDASGNYTQMGVILSAAYCLQWWAEEVNKDVDQDKVYEILRNEAKEIPAGSEGLIFLPYLTGERTPHPDVDARGTFIGLNPTHTRGHMTRAILEGVGFALRDSLEILKDMNFPINELRITGGGIRNILWVEIIASIFGQELHIVESSEGPAYGAAILAAVGCGKFDSVEEACNKLINVSNTIKPVETDIATYDKVYDVYKDLYPAIQSSFKRLASLR